MSKRFRLTLLTIVLFVLAFLALMLGRCSKSAAPRETLSTTPTTAPAEAGTPAALAEAPAEKLSPATLQGPASVVAGARFNVAVTGPKNPGDYVTLAAASAPTNAYTDYADVKGDAAIELTAPVEAGSYELRYVTVRSKTVLTRAPLTVLAAAASVTGPAQAGLGTTVSVSWTGPNNAGDYVTVVAVGTPDGRYDNYTETSKGSPLELTMPVEAGNAELRYMTGLGGKVLARSPIKIVMPEVALTAPDRVVAGTEFSVSWTGPDNHGDYVTIVPKNLEDGSYANYNETSKGSPLKLMALIEPGSAELRYMTGTGRRVLARRPIEIVAAQITLDAPDEVTAGAPVSITWKGPNNQGDYITIVPKVLPDGQYAGYTDAIRGSPLTVECPEEAGPAEIRYMSGQGAKVLARRPLNVVREKS
jgi:Ca-activated chloride channel family protein